MVSSKEPIRFLVALAGLVLFVALIWRSDPRALFRDFSELGWGMCWVILLGGASHLVKTYAWIQTFPKSRAVPRFSWLLGIRLAGEGISQLSFAGHLVGETTRAMMLRVQVPSVTGASTVVLDRILYGLTGIQVVVAGACLSLFLLPLPIELQRYNVAVLVVMGCVSIGVVVVTRRRLRIASGAMRKLGEWLNLEGIVARTQGVRDVEDIVYAFYGASKDGFWKATILNFLSHAMAILEVWLILRMMNVKSGLFDAFLVEAGAKIINLGGLLIPGNIGASEGASMLLLGILGLGAKKGLTLAIARRLRGLFWAGIGVLYFYLFMTRRSGAPEN